jgi:death on curing protein
MTVPIFLTLDQVLFIQKFEAGRTNSPTLVRDKEGLEAAISAPQATLDGEFLMDLCEMAATYITAISGHHPFLDGNKRTAVGGALTFLSFNGFLVKEERDEELADFVLDFINKKIGKDDLTRYFRERSVPKET